MKNITPETASIIMILDEAMVDIITRDEKPKSLLNARKKALEQTAGQICVYIDNYYDPKIIEVICHKKIDAIMEAKTAKELNEIVHSPKPTLYGGKLIDQPGYQFDEEELLNWCKAPPSFFWITAMTSSWRTAFTLAPTAVRSLQGHCSELFKTHN